MGEEVGVVLNSRIPATLLALPLSSPRARGFSWPMSSVLWVGGTPSLSLLLGKLTSLLITWVRA